MADTETDANELKRLRQLNFEQQKQVQLLREFTKASDGATKAIIDKVTPGLIELVKQSSLLSDELKDEVKSHKAAGIALEKAFKNLQEAKRLRDVFKQSSSKAGEVIIALKAMGIEIEKGSTNSERLRKTFERLDKESERLATGLADATAKMSRSSVRLSKELDGMRSRVTANIQKFFTLTSALGLATKAVTKFYDLGLDLVNKGMVGAMMTVTTQAALLKMNVSELSELLGKSKGTIQALGGGAQGIDRFMSAIKRTNEGLELFGKDASKISSKILDTLTKNGAGFGNKKIGEETLIWAGKMRDQYKEMYALFGDSAEEFASYYDEMLKSESLQARLNSMSSTQIRIMLQENMKRYENLRLLGLSNEQITTMNKTLETLYNPNKNRQVEAVRERYLGRAALQMSSNDLINSGDKEQMAVGKRLQEAISTGAYDQLRRMSPQVRQDAAANDPKMRQLLQDMAKNDDYQRIRRDATGGEESIYGYGASAARAGAGEQHELMTKLGQMFNQASTQGRDKYAGNTPEALRNKQRQRDLAGFKTNADGSIGDMTASAEAFVALRNAVDQVTSLMSNPLVAALGAATAALVLFTGSLATASVAGARGALGKLGSGAGKLMRGGLGGAARLAGVAGLAYEGYNIYDKATDPKASKLDVATQIAESASKLSSAAIGAAAGAALGTAILPGIGTAIGSVIGGATGYWGAGKIIDSARAPTASSALPPPAAQPSRSVSGRVTNEAMMRQTLEKAGITDPKQKAILMGQLSHESGGFRLMNEVGGGARYEGRRDLGNTQAGDGDRFRGRGFIQLTGRSNYDAAGKALGIDLVNNPDMAAQPEIASQIALWYLKSRKNSSGSTVTDLAARGDIAGVTKLINGGFNGYDDRIKRTQQYITAYSTPNTAPILNAIQQAPGPLTPAAIASITSSGPAVQSDSLLTENQKQTALLAQQTASLQTIASTMVKNRVTEGLQADRQTASSIG